MNRIYLRYLDDIKNENKKSIIYKIFLNQQSADYMNNTPDQRKVIDFIAGMTDEFFIKEIKKN
jgi:dGTPase